MLTVNRLSHISLHLILIISLVFPALGRVMPLQAAAESGKGLYRVEVRLSQPQDRARLEKLGVVILEELPSKALLLTDADQLADLARLRFEPKATDDLSGLLQSNSASSDLIQSLQPVIQQAIDLESLTNAKSSPAQLSTLRGNLHVAMQVLSLDQQAAIIRFSSIDDDGDGLTNLQEQWWCTNPASADSDGDGVGDAQEIQAAKDWLANRRAGPPASGKPFAGWPSQLSGCTDSDMDSVPDLAESRELGLNPNRESTDRDKFDDGQELFGNTYCPGSGGYCGYGALPRNEDWGVIFAEMPAWVKAPGNHPFVAAFPVPEIDVVESSLHMESATTITTDHTISQGEEHSYSTAKTEGTSTSVADMVTWNNWQEVSVARPLSTRQYLTHGLKSGSVAKGIGPEIGASFLTSGAEYVGGCLLDELGGINSGCGRIYDRRGEIKEAFSGAVEETLWDPNQKLWKNALHVGLCTLGTPATLSCAGKLFGSFLKNNHEKILENAALDPNAALNRGYEGYNLGISSAQASAMVNVQPIYQISYPAPKQMPTQTESRGRSWGGAQTTTHTQYEEHTVTNGEAFSNGQAWSTAIATDTAHAADLWFTYQIRNTGTEYAREIGNLAFNVYIGNDSNPAITYFVAPDLGGDGKFHNFMPGESHRYTSRRIPLTLNQMRAIDGGGPIRIVLENYTYGIDELFYSDAIKSGMMLAIDDGVDDGNEKIDFYLVPTWGEETVVDVLARYFPHQTDMAGNLIGISTPEFGTVLLNASPTTTWYKHVLSPTDWWSIYLENLGDGTAELQETSAVPGGSTFFRFNKDTDQDNYSDRSEMEIGTDSTDALSHPQPDVLAGLHNLRQRQTVTSTLLLFNKGSYDAYGTSAIIVAPDDSITIQNNLIGGGGRVRSSHGVVVGSEVAAPVYTNTTWHGTAQPISGGYYTGDVDRIYTLTALNTGKISTGTLQFRWSDGLGTTGTLNFGTSYFSPRLQGLGGSGVQLGFVSGNVQAGDTFTVAAHSPHDAFQYTINREPFTLPVVIVSYNDPQGNHRFVIPSDVISISNPTADLSSYGGKMLEAPSVELVTTAAFAPGSNTTNLWVNNPTGISFVNSHLFLEFINISGTVVSEIAMTATLQPGPTMIPMNWNTAAFSPTFRATENYIVMAFWVDNQGNIIDTAGRPLSSFQEDPVPHAVTSASIWDFGTVSRGTTLSRSLALGNIGMADLLAYPAPATTLTISPQGNLQLPPGDMKIYNLELNTLSLAVGPYLQTLALRTNDPLHPQITIPVSGTIISNTSPVQVTTSSERPWDMSVNVFGTHSQNEIITFPVSIPGPVEPVYVYSSTTDLLLGTGELAPNISGGTNHGGYVGSGINGDLTVASGQTVYGDEIRRALLTSVITGQNSLWMTDTTGFNVGQEVLVIQMQGVDFGTYEYSKITGLTTNTLRLAAPLNHSYQVNVTSTAQVIQVMNYRNLTVNNGGTLTVHPWDGATGGVLAIRASGIAQIDGQISVLGLGFRGGDRGEYSDAVKSHGWQGESYEKRSLIQARDADCGGGGGGEGDNDTRCCSECKCGGTGGGGGSNKSKGAAGEKAGEGEFLGGYPGVIYGIASFIDRMFPGSGGGAAAGRMAIIIPIQVDMEGMEVELSFSMLTLYI